jgi:DNA repair protein RadC
MACGVLVTTGMSTATSPLPFTAAAAPPFALPEILDPPLRAHEGPRERALVAGITALGDAELLAILLGTGLAGRPASLVATALLDEIAGLQGLLRLGPQTLAEHPGIGMAKALRIGAGLELGRRTLMRVPRPTVPLRHGKAVAEHLRWSLASLPHEEMWVLSLDGRNHLRGTRRVAQGGVHRLSVAPRDILAAAIADSASTFVLAHNHPSGDPTPSADDVTMTRMTAAAGEVMGIPLVDHVILAADGGYRSMLESGILEPI